MHRVFRGYNISQFLYFSIILQQENLEDPKPFDGLKSGRVLGAPGGSAPDPSCVGQPKVITVYLRYTQNMPYKVLNLNFGPSTTKFMAWALNLVADDKDHLRIRPL